MLQEIASVDGVAGYDAALVAMPNYYNEKGKIIVNTKDNVVNNFYTYGSLNSKYNSCSYLVGFELVEGISYYGRCVKWTHSQQELCRKEWVEVGR